jgi:hypothetical protein
MSDNVFTTESTSTNVPPVELSPQVDLLKTVLNERGEPKYSSLEEAFKGLANAQTYIPQLKTELDTKEQELSRLREELAKRQSVEEVVSRLTTAQQQQPQVTTSGAFDEQGIDALISSKLSAYEQQKLQKTNVEFVQGELVKIYGDKTKELVAAKAFELGMTAEELGTMAATKPKAVLSWFGQSTQHNTYSPNTHSSVNTSKFQQAPQEPVGRPEKSLLAGASTKDQVEYMRKIRAEVYSKHGITS